jgi:Tfp pilus assembly protein PilX
MTSRNRNPRRQRGAALVVGLILLVILTLLAVSGMNTASVELVMAGNEQYRQRAFQAAGTGVEEAVAVLATVPQTGTAKTLTKQAVKGTSTETYDISSVYVGDDLNVPGFSAGKFVGIHYQITSDGFSSRNAHSQQTQGAYIIQASGNGGPN